MKPEQKIQTFPTKAEWDTVRTDGIGSGRPVSSMPQQGMMLSLNAEIDVLPVGIEGDQIRITKGGNFKGQFHGWVRDHDILVCTAPSVWKRLTSAAETDDEHHKYEIENAIDLMDWLIEKKVLTSDEHVSLTKMLKSPDWENFYLAVEILNHRRHGIKI